MQTQIINQFQGVAGTFKQRETRCHQILKHALPHSSVRCSAEDPLLLRVARGEDAERTPVWLMRQAGRYMADFRKYSDRLPFRERSENAEIATELSLQPWRAFQPDGVIMFSDILTPLPVLGIEFDILKGRGPAISTPIRSMEQVRALRPMEDPDSGLPFIRQILTNLRSEVGNASTVLGFVGAPWTLAAYSMEGSFQKQCMATKKIMTAQPAVLHALLEHLTEALIVYVCHQIDSGAQVVQLFDSWAGLLSPAQFAEFSLPYAQRVIDGVRAVHPDTPLIFHANGGTGKLDRVAQCSADVIGLDWHTDMADARTQLGRERVLQGNMDPMLLFAPQDILRREVTKILRQAGPRKHILNVGHGVAQGTPEENVGLFCELARQSASIHAQADASPTDEDMQRLHRMGKAEVGLVGC
ncbi:Uroporphyrinogen decarboxylase [Coccomyxa sp. Obi]|nr:Uroporphyrinogen decarboxylase [Coccomyxa sp. Obi]